MAGKTPIISVEKANQRIQNADNILEKLEFDTWPPRIVSNLTKLAKAFSVPVGGLLVTLPIPFEQAMAHSHVKLERSRWKEVVLWWVAIHMGSGLRKTSIHKFGDELSKVVDR